jgi:excisionase family DNA binding protein
MALERSSVSVLTVRQAADRVNLSEWAIRRAIHDGELVAYKPRGQIRIEPADLDLWLEGTRMSPRPSEARRDPAADVGCGPGCPAAGTFRDRVRRKEAS